MHKTLIALLLIVTLTALGSGCGVAKQISEKRSYEQGQELMEKGNMESALKAFDKAIKADPNSSRAYCGRGYAKFFTLDSEGAIADYTKAVQCDPKSIFAYLMRAMTYFDMGDLDAAQKDARVVAQVAPGHPYAHTLQGDVLAAKGDLDGALEHYEEAIRNDPSNDFPQMLKGSAYYLKGELEKAFLCYKIARDKAGQNACYAAAFVWLTQSQQGDRETATEELREFISIYKAPEDEQWPTCIVKYLLGDMNEAAFLAGVPAKNVRREREQKVEAHFYIGCTRMLDGDKAKAIEQFQKCLDFKMFNLVECQLSKPLIEKLKAS